MKHTPYVRMCLCGLFFLLIVLLSGCSILSPIGQAISRGYENTVTYFNAYYNAKRLFSEAEDEIRTTAIASRGKDASTSPSAQISSTAKQKLGQVIDKCSNILAFHPTSNLVDDALLLIGKSFYYQMEYVKAERKFAELIAQYPNSSLVLETQLWYARTQEKLGKFEEGIHLSEVLVDTAHSSKNDEIEIQAHRLLGILYRRNKQIEKAIEEYEKVISLSKDDEIRSDAQISLGDIYFSNGQYAKAADVYLRTSDYTHDIYSIYYSRLQASLADREIGENKKGLELIDAMIEDFRFKEYRPVLYFERANFHVIIGRREEALDEYLYVDTAYARTDYATRSAHKLGQLYEKFPSNYLLAYKFYTEVNSASGLSAQAEGRRKYNAFTRYFAARQKLVAADSIFALLSDSTHKKLTDTLAVVPADTGKRIAARVVTRQMLPSADSLNVLKSLAAQELGDVFYDELGVPDSAFYWYNRSLALKNDHARTPRIFYVLAELSRTHPENKFPPPEDYYTRLDSNYSGSIYADEARRLLGKKSVLKKSDPAEEYYAQAEKQIEAKKYNEAMETLHTITQSFPTSPFAAKSEYTAAWIFENHLAQPDSALVWYKHVAKNYTGTSYATAAMRRFSDVTPLDTVKRDTVRTVKEKVKQTPIVPTDEEAKEHDQKSPPKPKDIIDRKVHE